MIARSGSCTAILQAFILVDDNFEDQSSHLNEEYSYGVREFANSRKGRFLLTARRVESTEQLTLQWS